MEKKLLDFIQNNSPDGGFLQSEYWLKFQESWGRKTYYISAKNNNEPVASAGIVTHTLPVVGDYFYVPRGPVICSTQCETQEGKIKKFLNDLVNLAGENNIGWIRVEPEDKGTLEIFRNSIEIIGSKLKIVKSPVDMQPREILMLEIAKSEEDILSGMKQKTRYNIRLAEKKGIKIFVSRESKYINDFLRLVEITSKRDKIKSHPENYYRKMFETVPDEILKLYLAEYEGKIIAANLVLFFGKTATYMHGASDNEHRNVMAPYLLQWQQILDAKKTGYKKYDFGGIKTMNVSGKSWEGITKFKTGFAPETKPIEFPGCYDVVLKSGKYLLYKILRKIKP